MNINILDSQKIKEILSRATYWEEVNRRPDSSQLLKQEAIDAINSVGIIKTMWILETYAEECSRINKESKPKEVL